MTRDQSAATTARIADTDLPMLDLFPVAKEHADLVHEWIHDPRAKCWLDLGGGRQDMSKRDLFLMVTSARNHARLFRLPGQDEPLGLICLNDSVNLMGSAEAWGVRGVYSGAPANISASAFVLALASGFVDLGREVIGSWVVDCNQFSVAMHLKLGFQETGRMRNRHLMNGRHYDRVLFDMTRSEFAERYPDVPSENGLSIRQLQMVAGDDIAADLEAA